MRAVESQLRKQLATEASGHGVASVSALWPSLSEPIAVWTPEESYEPAFLAYSVTKTFTSALLLSLCEDGRLSLDDPLARWFSQPGYDPVATAQRMWDRLSPVFGESNRTKV